MILKVKMLNFIIIECVYAKNPKGKYNYLSMHFLAFIAKCIVVKAGITYVCMCLYIGMYSYIYVCVCVCIIYNYVLCVHIFTSDE